MLRFMEVPLLSCFCRGLLGSRSFWLIADRAEPAVCLSTVVGRCRSR
jgi:hypothetical protein